MLKVFLVEDESVIREGLRDKIPWEQYGYRFVGEAADGEMALPLIRKARPDLLITDIKMPFMDGLSLSKMVRAEFPKIKIIIISGYDDFEYAREAIQAGVDQYLLKPVTRADLRKVLLELKEKIVQDVQQDAYRIQYQNEMRGSFLKKCSEEERYPLRRSTMKRAGSPWSFRRQAITFCSSACRKRPAYWQAAVVTGLSESRKKCCIISCAIPSIYRLGGMPTAMGCS